MWKDEAEVGRVVGSPPSLMGKWEVVIVPLQWFGLLIPTSPLFTGYPGRGWERKKQSSCLHYTRCKKRMGLMKPLFLLHRIGPYKQKMKRNFLCFSCGALPVSCCTAACDTNEKLYAHIPLLGLEGTSPYHLYKSTPTAVYFEERTTKSCPRERRDLKSHMVRIQRAVQLNSCMELATSLKILCQNKVKANNVDFFGLGHWPEYYAPR